MTPDEILQGLKNQRFWPNLETLDEDLHSAIQLIEHLCEINAKLISHLMEITGAVEDLTDQLKKQ